MDEVPVTVVILTYNEEIYIERAIFNVNSWAQQVFILDSGSQDKTCEIAKKLGAKVFYRKFDTYSKQRNYAIKELPIETEWMLFFSKRDFAEPKGMQFVIDCNLKYREKVLHRFF